MAGARSRPAPPATRGHSTAGSLAYYFMNWRHMTEILSAGQEVYTELLNLCVWAKSNGGMGSFYRSPHELVFLFKNGSINFTGVRLGSEM